MRPTTSSLVLFSSLCATACTSEPRAAPTPPVAADRPAEPSAQPQTPVQPVPGLMRCGDFFATSELTALGLDTKRYKEDSVQPTADLGLRCSLGNVGMVVFRRDKLSDVSDDENLAKTAGVPFKVIEGSPVGSDTRWTQLAAMYGVNFVSGNKHFTANVSGADRDLVYKVAKDLNAKMDKL